MNPEENTDSPEESIEEFEVSNSDSQQIYGMFQSNEDSEFAFELDDQEEKTAEKDDQVRSEPSFGEIARPPEEQKPVIGAADSVFENQNPEEQNDEEEVKTPAEKLSLREKLTRYKEDSTNDEYEQGFFAGLKEKIQLARMNEKEEIQETAGLDITPPSHLTAIKNRIFGKEEEGSDSFESTGEGDGKGEKPSAFSQILTPLSSSEVAVLQAEVAADETIFQSIEKSRTSAHVRQQIGFFLGLVLVVGFFLVQNTHYLTVTLTEASQPAWTPDFLVGDPMGAILFTVGLLLPLLVLLIVTSSTRYLIEGIVNKKIELLLIGAIGFFVSLACLFALMDGEVVLGVILLVVYALVAGARKVFRI